MRPRQATSFHFSSRPTTARRCAWSARTRSIRRRSVRARFCQAPTCDLAAWMQRCGVIHASSTSPSCCRPWSLVDLWPPATAMPTQAARCASSSTTLPTRSRQAMRWRSILCCRAEPRASMQALATNRPSAWRCLVPACNPSRWTASTRRPSVRRACATPMCCALRGSSLRGSAGPRFSRCVNTFSRQASQRACTAPPRPGTCGSTWALRGSAPTGTAAARCLAGSSMWRLRAWARRHSGKRWSSTPRLTRRPGRQALSRPCCRCQNRLCRLRRFTPLASIRSSAVSRWCSAIRAPRAGMACSGGARSSTRRRDTSARLALAASRRATRAWPTRRASCCTRLRPSPLCSVIRACASRTTASSRWASMLRSLRPGPRCATPAASCVRSRLRQQG